MDAFSFRHGVENNAGFLRDPLCRGVALPLTFVIFAHFLAEKEAALSFQVFLPRLIRAKTIWHMNNEAHRKRAMPFLDLVCVV